MNIDSLLNWFKDLVYGFATAGNWLTKSFIYLNGNGYNVFSFLTFTGLTVFIGVAIVKWMVA